jgi:hypothetical protein
MRLLTISNKARAAFSGKSLSLDGNGQYVTLGTPVTASGDFTAVIWFKRAYTTNIVGFTGYHTLGNSSKIGMYGAGGTENNKFLYRGDDSNGAAIRKFSLGYTSALDNTWCSLVVIRENGIARMSLNGGAFKYDTVDSSGNFSTSMIGFDNSNLQYHNGNIGGFGIWSRVLSADEITLTLKSPDAVPIGMLDAYKFDNTTSTTTSSVLGNVATYVGGAKLAEDGIYGRKLLGSKPKQLYSIKMDGVGDCRIDTPATAQSLGLTATNKFTTEAWINPTGESSICTVSAINTNYTSWLATSGSYVLLIRKSGSAYRAEFFVDTVTGRNTTILSSYTIQINQWTHVAGSYDGVNAKLYVNGVLIGTEPITGNLMVNSNNKVSIGVLRHIDSFYFFTGQISNVRIWDKALSAADILQYCTNFDLSDPAIKEQWKLDHSFGELAQATYNPANTTKIKGTYTWQESTAPVNNKSGMLFGGTNGEVSIPHNTAYKTQNITVEFWMYAENTGTRHLAVTTWVGFTTELWYTSPTHGHLQWGLYSLPSQYFKSNPIVEWNTWNHFACTYDSTTGRQAIYINGTLDKEQTVFGTINYSINPLYFSGYWQRMKGRISCVRIWNYARNADDIKQNMHRYVRKDSVGLVDQWRLTEGWGTTVYGDKGFNGTISGDATWQTPTHINWRNQHIRFNGSNRVYVNNPLINQVGKSQRFTVEAWVKLDAAGNPSNAKRQRLLTGLGDGLTLDYFGLNTLLYLNFGADDYYRYGKTGIKDGNWHHIAFVFDNWANIIKIYLNGVDDTGNGPNKTYTPLPMQPQLTIGADLEGCVDELRIWSVPRTQAEIQENMYKTINRHPNLAGHWRFDGDAWDSSGFGNHGTLSGTPVFEINKNKNRVNNAPIND